MEGVSKFVNQIDDNNTHKNVDRNRSFYQAVQIEKKHGYQKDVENVYEGNL